MAAKGSKSSKRASTSGVRERVTRLTAAREALDAEQAERRRQEDAAFTRYAEAAARAETITGERDAELDELQRERTRVEQRATERLQEVETEQRAVLAELNTAGRSAEDLAALFELPVKRVRTLLRASRSASTANTTTPPTGTASPAATRSRPATTDTDGSEPDTVTSPSATGGTAATTATAPAATAAGHAGAEPAIGDASPGNE